MLSLRHPGDILEETQLCIGVWSQKRTGEFNVWVTGTQIIEATGKDESIMETFQKIIVTSAWVPCRLIVIPTQPTPGTAVGEVLDSAVYWGTTDGVPNTPLPHPHPSPPGPFEAFSTVSWRESALSVKFRTSQLYPNLPTQSYRTLLPCTHCEWSSLSPPRFALPLLPGSSCSLPGVMLPPTFSLLTACTHLPAPVKSHLSWSFPTPIRTRILPFLWRIASLNGLYFSFCVQRWLSF